MPIFCSTCLVFTLHQYQRTRNKSKGKQRVNLINKANKATAMTIRHRNYFETWWYFLLSASLICQYDQYYFSSINLSLSTWPTHPPDHFNSSVSSVDIPWCILIIYRAFCRHVKELFGYEACNNKALGAGEIMRIIANETFSHLTEDFCNFD